jgi:hypothetical protein
MISVEALENATSALEEDQLRALDEAIDTGNGFDDLLEKYGHFLDNDGSKHQTTAKSIVGVVGNFFSQAGSYVLNTGKGKSAGRDTLRRASHIRDPDVLSHASSSKWQERLSRSAESLRHLAAEWLLQQLETVSEDWAQKASAEQARRIMQSTSDDVTAPFEATFDRQVAQLKDELNQREARNSDSYVLSALAVTPQNKLTRYLGHANVGFMMSRR